MVHSGGVKPYQAYVRCFPFQLGWLIGMNGQHMNICNCQSQNYLEGLSYFWHETTSPQCCTPMLGAVAISATGSTTKELLKAISSPKIVLLLIIIIIHIPNTLRYLKKIVWSRQAMINRHHVTQRLYGASVRCSTLALSLLIREKVKDGKLDKWSLGPNCRKTLAKYGWMIHTSYNICILWWYIIWPIWHIWHM